MGSLAPAVKGSVPRAAPCVTKREGGRVAPFYSPGRGGLGPTAGVGSGTGCEAKLGTGGCVPWAGVLAEPAGGVKGH